MPHFLDKFAHHISSRVGGVIPGERAVFLDKDIHKDMDAFQMRLMGQLLFGITGREFSSRDVMLIEASIFLSQYPDTRIWCNRVAGLAGSTRSTPTLAQCAAAAVGEATIYGRKNEIRVFQFLTRTRAKLAQGQSLSECLDYQLKHHKLFPGYGRPLANADERIKPFLDYLDRASMPVGPYVRLAFEVEREILDRGMNLRMNYGAVISAFAADMGLSAKEFAATWAIGFWNGAAPCYTQAVDNPALSLYPLAPPDITYTGPARRELSKQPRSNE